MTTMLPPIHGPCERLAALDISIRDSWSDEELVRFLAGRKAEDPLPQDVLAGLDFSVVDPRGFTDIWYLNWSDDQQPYDSAENSIRKAKNGYWKPLDSSRIPTSTAIIGVKIVLEFYEGQAPCGKRTGWVMHEYQVEQNDDANLPQDYKSLCKVFQQCDKKINVESGQNSLNADAPNDSLESYLQYLSKIEEPKTVAANDQDIFSSEGQHEQKAQSAADDIDVHDVIATGDYIELNDLLNFSSKGQHEQKTQSAADDIAVHDVIATEDYIELNDLLISSSKGQHEQKTQRAEDDIDVHDAIATGDYIELNDLLSSEASASTSENSSKRSMISEEYFDSDAFLREILNGSNTTDEQDQDRKFSIAAPTKSANVVISPSEQGLVQIRDNNATVAGTSPQKPVPGGDRDQHSSKGFQEHGPSLSSCFPSSHVKRGRSSSSSSSQSSMSQRERSSSKFGKIGKKYCCFGSF
ncbi:NAC domain-containing protein 37-like isoform X2 [Phragmites australis]|uniref:NAC domain-containing protein 37-like isoform X2 n=1 Tax=Phragmites australis TaxID=29695 RepID=UPI002D79289D|nr:NAC domain-containing protein 37-like isoform X2 [Phragmites australis]